MTVEGVEQIHKLKRMKLRKHGKLQGILRQREPKAGEKTYELAGYYYGLFYTDRRSLLLSLYGTQMLSIPYMYELGIILKNSLKFL
jgi:hypothetical protein